MNNDELKELYKTDKSFKEYVDAYAEHYTEGKSIPVEEALKHQIVKDYADWLRRNN